MKAVALLILAWLGFADSQIQCTLCGASGGYPAEPFTAISVDGGYSTCQEAYDRGVIFFATIDECTFYQNLGKYSCNCQVGATPPKQSCSLCQDGGSLPNPNYRPWPGFTCAELQSAADRNNVCRLYQTTLGPYCGCQNTVIPSGTCRLCGSKTLPQPSRITTEGISCLEREFLGSLSGICPAQRQAYAQKCCATPGSSTPQPTRRPPTRVASRQPTRRPSIRTPTRKPTTRRIPTRRPTRKQPASPSAIPPQGCFSGDMFVTSADGVRIAMKDLKVCNYIQDGANSFSRIYSFGHHDVRVRAVYLRIYTEGQHEPLELSAEHMVYGTEKQPHPASSLQVGDLLLQPSGSLVAVTNIETVYRKGAYAPFTYSGKLVVNGVVVSSYIVAVDHGVPTSQHWISHLFQVPHRLCVRLGGCAESYTEHGVSSYASGLYKVATWWMKQQVAFRALLFIPVFLLLLVLTGVEAMMMSTWTTTLIIALVSVLWFQPGCKKVVRKH
jgi:Hint module